MSKMYKSDNGLVTMTGTVKSIAEDKMSAVVTYDKWDIVDKTNILTESTIFTISPIEEQVGDLVTVQGWVEASRGQTKIIAEIFTKENTYCEMQDGNKRSGEPNVKALLAGEVLFANERTEINEDGTAKLNKAGTPKKPHFDITIATGKGEDRVTHVVKIYDFAERTKADGTFVPAQHNIERYKKAFSKFDREKNPIYVWCMTSPGDAYQTTKGQYTNNNMSHMGVASMDITYLPKKEKTNTTPVKVAEPVVKEVVAETAATAIVPEEATEPVVAATQNASGFDASNIQLDDVDSDFTIE